MSTMSNLAIICEEAIEEMSNTFSFLAAIDYVADAMGISTEDAEFHLSAYCDSLED